jgi:hypothetical protein
MKLFNINGYVDGCEKACANCLQSMEVTRMHKCIMKHQTTGNCAVERNKARCTCKEHLQLKVREMKNI